MVIDGIKLARTTTEPMERSEMERLAAESTARTTTRPMKIELDELEHMELGGEA